MKKIKTFIICISTMVLFLSGCGLKTSSELEHTFNKAYISYGNGNLKVVELDSWSYYNENQILITGNDGTVYLVDSTNCTFIKEPDINE